MYVKTWVSTTWLHLLHRSHLSAQTRASVLLEVAKQRRSNSSIILRKTLLTELFSVILTSLQNILFVLTPLSHFCPGRHTTPHLNTPSPRKETVVHLQASMLKLSTSAHKKKYTHTHLHSHANTLTDIYDSDRQRIKTTKEEEEEKARFEVVRNHCVHFRWKTR